MLYPTIPTYYKYLYLLTVLVLWSTSVSKAQNQRKADSLIQVLQKNKRLSDSAKLIVLKGIYTSHTNQDERLKYAKESFALASKLDSYIWKFKSMANIGHAYRKKGDLEKALEAHLQCAEYAVDHNDKRREALAYSAIGSVYRVQENLKTALYYYNLGISRLRENKDSTNLAKSLMNTGELYRTNHILDTALLYFEESGMLFEKLNYKIGIAYNRGNIGLVYAEKGMHDLAEKNILQASKILEALGDRYPIAVYQTYMSDIYSQKGDNVRALEFAKMSYIIGQEEGLKEQSRDASLTLSVLYEKEKDFVNAYFYQKQYIAYRDSINSESTIREMADLRTEFEVAQKQVEVDLLNQKEKVYVLVALGLAFTLLMIAAFTYVLNKRYKEKREANQLLTTQKQQLETQSVELEKLNATKDRFFSIVSHDLRGPVNAFVGLTSIIKMSVEAKRYEDLEEMVERLEESSNGLSVFLNNLLNWAMNQQSEVSYQPERIALEEVFSDLQKVLQNMADGKSLDLNFNSKEDVSPWADKNSLKVILRNLINNALKFTEPGGSVSVEAEIKNEMACILIKDTGVGIPEDKMQSLFELDTKKSTAGTKGEKGVGLGLRLAYDFTTLNKGSIQVQSTEGKGSVFTVMLPLHVD